jgi:hypothetical protein
VKLRLSKRANPDNVYGTRLNYDIKGGRLRDPEPIPEVHVKKLACQECRGEGGWREIIDPEIGGPWYPCEWCEGSGFVSPDLRGRWLRCKRDIKLAEAKGIDIEELLEERAKRKRRKK